MHDRESKPHAAQLELESLSSTGVILSNPSVAPVSSIILQVRWVPSDDTLMRLSEPGYVRQVSILPRCDRLNQHLLIAPY
jgi:hypothetical protein